MDKKEFLELVDLYVSGKASAEQEEMLLRFYDSFQGEDVWKKQMAGLKEELESRMLNRLMNSIHQPETEPVKISSRYSLSLIRGMAAAVAILLLAGSLFYFGGTDRKWLFAGKEAEVEKAQPVLQPGGNRALLKLADGSTIVLSNASNGVLAMQGSTAVKKTDEGELIYVNGRSDAGDNKKINVIETPKGGQYQLTLPDGTRVWLNSESSLSFPTSFGPRDRRVELSGEAYFEVATAYKAGGTLRKPFFVKSGAMTVEVLGTHFNIMAYPDALKQEATLLEGSVIVEAGKVRQKISPGEQAFLENKNFPALRVRHVSLESTLAWKEGLFMFDNTGIDEAMQQIEKWYDAEVIYDGSKPEVAFTGVLPRSSEVSKVLDLLESAQGVKFTVQGKKIIVRKTNQ